MIRAYSQRLLPPYSGQVQIAESARARVVSMDREIWEVHYRRDETSFSRATWFKQANLAEIVATGTLEGEVLDDRIHELAVFLSTATLPFPAADGFEYWLLDAADESPLALIFSCIEGEHMARFPAHTEWTALPSAAMRIELSPEEKGRGETPVNHRLERLVAERAGRKPRARWFHRRPSEPDSFPPFMVREDWPDARQNELCQRYIHRQASRLLMLHGLERADRLRLEQAAQAQALEVLRFHALYPEVADEALMRAILVEARMRVAAGELDGRVNRREGVLYL
ncbi:MAG: hypothetical protein B7Y26_04740 [Hydrogenophilales bacterium 16-64-46]|nr:MAG: hypothetical protein B7Z32_04450 [Hydrogenophilales bacterium 12-64-13]OYZ06280.1 MAG: hypothetical protein B7Y26_04740 [Hydrogenophilales bacterium 16-64-46]OZA38821.1 MAG: hypothetical protein B7X87_05150 [Hydrogenophilales bacterium 17-64-34]HQS99544.1 hypothetical protein [Thiobacillus sp.]